MWPQDLQNSTIYNREQNTFGSRVNYLFPITQSNKFDQQFANTKVGKSENIQTSNADIRDISRESHLFYDQYHNSRDLSPTPDNQDENEKYESKKNMYRIYHQSGINSICYPDVDQNMWDNLNKALYQTVDRRDRSVTKIKRI